MLLDGYPSRYLPYIMRNHRWTRGDWQIIKWLKNDRLNEISKFKIYDNLRRSVLQITAFALIIISIFNFSSLFYLFVLGIISCIIPYLIDIINYIIFKESNITGAVYAYKKFSNELNSLKISIIRIILQILFLPFEMYKNLDSIIRSLYRMKKCKKLLEWVTAEDGENEICTIAAIVMKTISEEKKSKLIIYANELFAMDMPVQINGYQMYTVNLYNNEDLILNSLAYLNEREDTITIRKDYQNVNYTVTEQQNIIIMTIIFVLPVVIIIAGIIIWQIRRRSPRTSPTSF